MSGTNTPAPVPQEKIKIVTALELPLSIYDLTPTQLGWLKLEKTKTATVKDLTTKELEIQQVLANIKENKDLPKVQELIKDAKSKLGVLKDQRLQFTGMIENNLFKVLMEHEKRGQGLIEEASAHELVLRKEQSAKAATVNELETEKAKFKAHVISEYHVIAANYRQLLSNSILAAYEYALTEKTPVEQIPAYIAKTKDILATIPVPKPRKYQELYGKVQHLTADIATEIHNSIPAYKPELDLTNSYKELEDKFALYEQDLQNAVNAIKLAKEENEKVAAQRKDDAELEKSAQNLIAAASAATIEAPKIKKSYEIVEHNNQAWAMAVVTHFIKRIANAGPKLRVRTWSKLTVAQMGKALADLKTETGEDFSGLAFTEIEK